MAPKLHESIRKELIILLDAGIIVPSSAAWSFSVVTANNMDGTLKFCDNYRSLDRFMIVDQYPLSRLDEIFDNLKSCIVFYTLDLFTGYWEVRMSKACKEKINFVTLYKTVQFEVMPLSVMNAPSTFPLLIGVVVQDVSFERVYIDGFVIISKSFEEHMDHLRDVFAN